MSDQKRMLLLLGLVSVLIIANLFVYMGDDGFDASMFGVESDLDLAPRAAKMVTDLESLPRLDFGARAKTDPLDIINRRNPFIFGVDRAKEAERQQRMEELRQAREVVEVAEVSEPVVEKARFDGRVIGIMGSSKDPSNQMVSVSLDQEIHILRVGDRLKNRYRLTGVNPQQVTFLHLASGEEVTIRLETK